MIKRTTEDEHRPCLVAAFVTFPQLRNCENFLKNYTIWHYLIILLNIRTNFASLSLLPYSELKNYLMCKTRQGPVFRKNTTCSLEKLVANLLTCRLAET